MGGIPVVLLDTTSQGPIREDHPNERWTRSRCGTDLFHLSPRQGVRHSVSRLWSRSSGRESGQRRDLWKTVICETTMIVVVFTVPGYGWCVNGT